MRKMLVLLLASLLLALAGWSGVGAKHTQAHRLKQRIAALEDKVSELLSRLDDVEYASQLVGPRTAQMTDDGEYIGRVLHYRITIPEGCEGQAVQWRLVQGLTCSP